VSDRFYSPTPITTERVTLDGAEAHHLIHVMRAAVGTEITLFDGSGAEFSAVVEVLRRSDAVVRVVERREIDRELPFELVIGVALPKGDRQKWLVEKLTELGVSTLVPLVTERGVAQPTAGALERLSRSAIEAAKQCGRNRLLKIAEPQSFAEFTAAGWVGSSASESPVHSLRLIAHPNGPPLSEIATSGRTPVALAIGPEGGLTEAEVASALAAGCQQVSLGPRILRVETAAIALAAVVALK